MLAEVLSSEERERFAECERTIERNLMGAFDLGAALEEINVSRLYRESHETFESYVEQRWNIQRGYAYGLMSASAIKSNLAGHFEKLPENEFQVRPLAKLDPEDQRKVWGQILKQIGPAGHPFHKIVKAAVNDLVESRKALSDATHDLVHQDDTAVDHQYLLGDPVQLIAGLGEQSCDLLLIGDLSGSTPQGMADNLLNLLRASVPAMRPDHQVFVITDLPDYRLLLEAAESLFYEVGVPLVWVTNKERSISDWCAKSSSRYILHLRRGTAGLATQIGNVISCGEEDFKRHPDQRPLVLVRALIEAATRPGDTVLDPTAVAATANIASRQIGRRCIGIVNNSEAYEAGVERLDEINNFQDTESN